MKNRTHSAHRIDMRIDSSRLSVVEHGAVLPRSVTGDERPVGQTVRGTTFSLR
jgi:hypothetical protein